MMMFRQGDILFVASPPVKESKTKEVKDGIIAEGEATGHAHRLKTGGRLIITEDGTMYISSQPGALITHEEHGDFTLPEGFFKVIRQREYDATIAEKERNERWRQVAD